MNKSKFAPFNDTIENNPDKDRIFGNYSTFDPELSKIAATKPKTIAEKKAILERAVANLSKKKLYDFNIFVGNQYIRLLLRKDIKARIKEFNSMRIPERESFTQNIIDEMSKIIDPSGKLIPKIPVVRTFLVPIMGFERDSDNDDNNNFIHPENQKIVAFLNNLFHEFIHIVDHYAPNLGPLGAQIMQISRDNFIDHEDDIYGYHLRPTEINAYQNFDRIYEMIRAVIKYIDDPNIISINTNTPMKFFTDAKMKD